MTLSSEKVGKKFCVIFREKSQGEKNPSKTKKFKIAAHFSNLAFSNSGLEENKVNTV